MPMSMIRARTTDDVRLTPLYPCDAKRMHVNIPPSTTIRYGTLLGKSGAGVDAVHTVATTGTPTGGTFTLTGTHPTSGGAFTTAAIAFNAAAATVATAVQTAMNASGPAVTVTGGGGALPTAVTLTYTGAADNRSVPVLTLGTNALTGGTNPTVTIANTTAGTTAGTYAAYVGGGGTDPAVGICEYTVTSRADGTIHVGETIDADSGEALPSVPMYVNGWFACEDLIGLDAGAVADLNGSLTAGNTSTGVLKF